MGKVLSGLALLAWLCIKACLFVFKITVTYFLKCARDLAGQIKDEWKNREIDDEIY